MDAEAKIKLKFGKRVRQLRADVGISQEELEDKCGLDRSYVGSVERGQRNLSLINIHKIARALGLETAELFK